MNRDDIMRSFGDSVEKNLRHYIMSDEIKSRGERRSVISAEGKKIETRLMNSMLSTCRSLTCGDVSAKEFLSNFMLFMFQMIDMYSDEIRCKHVYSERDLLLKEIDALNQKIRSLENKADEANAKIKRQNDIIVGRVKESDNSSISSLNLKNLNMDLVAPAIYFLMRGDEILYIGQSVQIYGRIRNHVQEARIPFTNVLFLTCQKEDLNAWEAALIIHFDPPFNGKKKFSSNIDLHSAIAEVIAVHGTNNN